MGSASFCDPDSQQRSELLGTRSRGTVLVLVAWLLACTLAFCIAARAVLRYKARKLPNFHFSQDAIVIAASLCTFSSTMMIFTAVDSGLGRPSCLLAAMDIEQIQQKIYIFTTLVIVALSISKISPLIFIHNTARRTWVRDVAKLLSGSVIVWVIAMTVGLVVQCELPMPWGIWTNRCSPLLPIWLAMMCFDIVIEISIFILASCALWRTKIEHRQKLHAIGILSFRFLIIAASGVRLICFQRALSKGADPTYDFVPYAIATQCYLTLSIISACSLMLKPFTLVIDAGCESASKHDLEFRGSQSKRSSFAVTQQAERSSFANLNIVKERLSVIHASMLRPMSPLAAKLSTSFNKTRAEDIEPTSRRIAPIRPLSPAENERLDMSIFTRRITRGSTPIPTGLPVAKKQVNRSTCQRGRKIRSLPATMLL